MIPDRLLKLLAAVIVLTFVMACLLHQSLYGAFTSAATAGGLFLALWDRYLWHMWPFYRYFDKKPDLRGTWQGRLHSNYRDPETQQQRVNIESYLVIRQTYSKIDVRYFSGESGSVSLSANLFADSEGVFTLACTYRNTPRMSVRERSPMGHGGVLLSVRGKPIHRIEGEYWTDRQTKGEMEFTARSEKLADDFQQAQGFGYETLGS